MSDMDRASLEDRLPWLEPVEDEDQRAGAGAGTLVAALVAALVALGLVVGGIFWLRDRQELSGGAGELIAAPAGAYKERPTEPGGMKVEGQGDAAFAASAGADVNSSIDISALPETPVAGAGSVAAADAPVAHPAAAGAAPTTLAKSAPVQPAAPAAAGAGAAPVATVAAGAGGMIQLGAFSSEAKANQAWKSLSGRFAYLKPLTSSITPVAAGGNTLYRLRVSGGDVRTACAKLKVAGETCSVVG